MKRPLPIGLALMLAGVVLVALARPWESDLRHEIQDATQLTNRMETHCIGRFLIDMPAEAQVEFGQATIDGFNIAAFVETPEEFKKRLAAREAEIRAKPDQQVGTRIWSRRSKSTPTTA